LPKPARRPRTKAEGNNRKAKKSFSICGAFEKAFEVFNRNRRPFLGLGVYLLVCTAAEQGFYFGMERLSHQGFGWMEIAVCVGWVVVWFTDLFFSVKLVRLSLDKVKGKRRSFKTPYGAWLGTARYFHASVLYGLSTLVGMVLLVVPGVMAMVAFSLAPYAALETRTKTWRSLQISWELTRSVRWKMLGFFCVTGLFLLFGFLCLGVGLIVAWPVTTIAWVVVYRDLERQTKLPKLELLKAKV
jgi:hypothetical protein